MNAAALPAPRKSASHGEAGYERKERDFYPTEPWVTRALCRAVDFRSHAVFGLSRSEFLVWEPACGDGRMARELEAAGYDVVASDIADYGYSTPCLDFLDAAALAAITRGGKLRPVAGIVTNPPFNLAVQFILRGLELTHASQGKVAILQRHEFDAPVSNHPLFQPPNPFAAKLVLPRRPRWSDEDKASPRFPYAWYLWDWRWQGEPVLRYLADPDKAPKAVGRLL